MAPFFFWDGSKPSVDIEGFVTDEIKNLTINKYKGYFLVKNENDRYILNILCRNHNIPNKFYYCPAKYYYENMLDKSGKVLGWVPEEYKEA